MANHTTPPWVIELGGGHACNRIVGNESVHTNGKQRNRLGISSASYSERICENLGDLNLPGPQANANLIVAAPDLLDACEYVLDITGGPASWSGETYNALVLVEDAVAKAKGKS